MNTEDQAENKQPESNEDFVNPIDEDKITESPHTLPYAHTIGGAVIKPVDKGRVKGLAMSAMYEQTDMQIDQIKEQIELLAQQAKKIQDRVEISERIYQSEVGFQPRIGHLYHLYERKNGKHVVSMVAPKEWGSNPPFKFIASVKLLADHTWDIID